MNKNFLVVFLLATVIGAVAYFLLFNKKSNVEVAEKNIASSSSDYLKARFAKNNFNYDKSKKSFENFFEINSDNNNNLKNITPLVKYNLMKLSILSNNLEKASIYATSLYSTSNEFSEDFLTLMVLSINELLKNSVPTKFSNKEIGERKNYDFSFKISPAYVSYLEKLINTNNVKISFAEGSVMSFYFKEISTIIKTWLYLIRLDKSKALELITKTPEFQKKPIFQYHLALIYQILGDTKNAKQSYEKINLNDCLTTCKNSKVAFFNKINSTDTISLIKNYQNIWTKDRPLFEYEQSGFNIMRYALYDIISHYAAIAFAFENFGDAEMLYHLILLINSESEIANIALGKMYSILDNQAKAIEFLNKIKIDSPFYQEALAESAFCHFQLGKTKEYEKILSKIEITQATVPSLIKIIQGLIEKKNYSKALTISNNIIKSKEKFIKNDWILFYLRGVIYDEMEDWKKAKLDLEKALSISPDEPIVLNYIGYKMLELNEDLQKAKNMLGIALSKDSRNPYILDSFGYALYKLGDFENALKFIEQANALAPSELEIAEHLGDVYFKLGRKKEANFEWFRVLQLTEDAEKRARLKQKINDSGEF